MAWGLADAYVVIRYLISAIRRGTIPFIGDLAAARETASQLDYDLMVWISTAGAAVMSSLIISSALLLLRKPAGVILSYIQAPFRVLMVLPSIPFLPWLFSVSTESKFEVAGIPGHIAAGFLLIAALELARVLSLTWWRRGERAVKPLSAETVTLGEII